MRRLSRITVWGLGVTAALLAAALAALAVLLLVEVPVDLAPLRPDVSARLSQALGRPVRLEGRLVLLVSFWPALEATDLHLANPPGWGRPDFARARLLRGQVGLLPLLRGKIRVAEFTAQDVQVFPEVKPDGRNNWGFLLPPQSKTRQPPATSRPAAIELVEVRRLSLRDVALSYRDGAAGRVLRMRLDQLTGRTTAGKSGKSLQVKLKGIVQRRPYALSLRGPSPVGLLDEGRPWPLTLKGKVAGSPLQGRVVLKPPDGRGGASLELSAQRVNLGAVGRWLGLDPELKVRAGGVRLQALVRGRSLPELLKHSGFRLTVSDGRWQLHDPSTQAPLKILVRKGVVRASGRRPLSVDIDGLVGEVPVQINLTSLELPGWAQPLTRLPLRLHIQAAGASLAVDGRLALPVDSGESSFDFSLQGHRLDSLEKLLLVNLPPLGPYSLGGRLALSSAGYRLRDLKVRLGQSDLSGQASLTDQEPRPRLEIRLATDTLQINDILPPGRKEPAPSRPPDAGPQAAPPAKPDIHIELDLDDEKIKPLFSPAVLASLDGRLELKVGRVFSGSDRLGGGLLRASLQDGRLVVDPLRLEVPGGSVRASLDYRPTPRERDLRVGARIRRLDYGVLARRLDPQSKAAGRVSLIVDLHTRAPAHTRLMASASGRIAFALWPQNLAAGAFDLWAVNLLSAVVARLGGPEASRVNCIYADLEMKKGLMKQKAMVIDTTQMRVTGEAEINFRDQTVYAYFEPQAKKPQFFGLATPIEVKGTFAQAEEDLAPGGLVSTAIRFVGSPLFTPLLRLFGTYPPADGSDVCRDPLGEMKKQEKKK